MNCMKCGRETVGENVFCQDCLEIMEKYPVFPSAVVMLPRRRDASALKKMPKRHVLTAEEQVVSLRKWVITLLLLLAACAVAIVLMFGPTMHYLMDQHVEIGQNYSSVVPATTADGLNSAR